MGIMCAGRMSVCMCVVWGDDVVILLESVFKAGLDTH